MKHALQHHHTSYGTGLDSRGATVHWTQFTYTNERSERCCARINSWDIDWPTFSHLRENFLNRADE